MSISLGDKKVPKMYLGDAQVKKAYLGSDLLYSSRETLPLYADGEIKSNRMQVDLDYAYQGAAVQNFSHVSYDGKLLFSTYLNLQAFGTKQNADQAQRIYGINSAGYNKIRVSGKILFANGKSSVKDYGQTAGISCRAFTSQKPSETNRARKHGQDPNSINQWYIGVTDAVKPEGDGIPFTWEDTIPWNAERMWLSFCMFLNATDTRSLPNQTLSMRFGIKSISLVKE